MGVKIRFEIANEVQFSKAFKTAAEKVDNFSVPFQTMADEFYQTMVNVFAAEGAHERDKKWTKLSPAYAKWKQKHYPDTKILERTGRMLRSLTVPGSPDNVTAIYPRQMVLGTQVPYSVFHQFGTKTMPKRKIIQLSQEQKKRWVHIIHNFLFKIYDQAAKETKE